MQPAWQVKAIRQGLAEANIGMLFRHEKAVKRLKIWVGRNS